MALGDALVHYEQDLATAGRCAAPHLGAFTLPPCACALFTWLGPLLTDATARHCALCAYCTRLYALATRGGTRLEFGSNVYLVAKVRRWSKVHPSLRALHARVRMATHAR